MRHSHPGHGQITARFTHTARRCGIAVALLAVVSGRASAQATAAQAAAAQATATPRPVGADTAKPFKVSFGVDYFFQSSTRRNYPYKNDAFEDHETFFWERLRPRLSGTNGRVSFMIEGQDTHARGSTFSNRTAYLDLLNAWVDVQRPSGLSFRAGRRQGDFDTISRLVRTPDFAAIVRSFDTAEVGWENKTTEVRGFVFHTVDNVPKSFNTWKPGERLWTVFGNHRIGRQRLQTYVTTKINTVGARSESGLAGDAAVYAWETLASGSVPVGGLSYSVEHILQRGHVSSDRLRAAALFTSLSKVINKTEFDVRFNRLSGDKARGDGVRNSYDPFYMANAQLSSLGLMRGSNLTAFVLVVTHTFSPKAQLVLRFYDSHLTERNDGWYLGASASLSPTLVRPTATSSRIGDEVDTQFTYSVSSKLNIRSGVYKLWPGAYLTETGNHGAPYEVRLQIFGRF